ncbi:MAG: LuxR C-terminal-related transcriptional regulator [Sporichthyaceae bacterium]
MIDVLVVDDDHLMRAGLTRSVPDLRVLILTTFEHDDYLFGALRAGASGFLLKRSRPEELIAAVHTVAAGEAMLAPAVTRRVVEEMMRTPNPRVDASRVLEHLTPREREVLAHVARGLANREIAALLVVEESTVRTHVKRVFMKLALRDRVQAVILAYECGLVQPGCTSEPPFDPNRTG